MSVFSGIDLAVIRDQRVRYKVVISVVFLLLGLLFDDWLHFLLLLAVTGLMVVSEVFSSSIAALCDYVQPQYDSLITDIKDMAAGASWIAVFIWTANILIGVYELLARFRTR